MLTKTAVISGDYRYLLTRKWSETNKKTVCFIMLNPSTADADKDDPTIRKCIKLAKSWGFGQMNIVNLFALRSTDPAVLAEHHDPVGPENKFYLTKAAQESDVVVAAWGLKGRLLSQDLQTLYFFKKINKPLHYLKFNRGGIPCHPLYQKDTSVYTKLEF